VGGSVGGSTVLGTSIDVSSAQEVSMGRANLLVVPAAWGRLVCDCVTTI